MMQKYCLMFLALLGAGSSCTLTHAQSITGYSATQESWFCPPGTTPPPRKGQPVSYVSYPPGTGPVPCTQQNGLMPSASVYSNINEDYTAALYYDVENVTAEYYGNQAIPLNLQDSGAQNGAAGILGGYSYQDAN